MGQCSINNSRKDATVAGVNRLFVLVDLFGFFLDQSSDNRVSVAERSTLNIHTGFRARTAACRRMS